MVGQRLEKLRKQLGTERAKVLVDVSKAMAIASFIGAGTVLRSSLGGKTNGLPAFAAHRLCLGDPRHLVGK